VKKKERRRHFSLSYFARKGGVSPEREHSIDLHFQYPTAGKGEKKRRGKVEKKRFFARLRRKKKQGRKAKPRFVLRRFGKEKKEKSEKEKDEKRDVSLLSLSAERKRKGGGMRKEK